MMYSTSDLLSLSNYIRLRNDQMTVSSETLKMIGKGFNRK